MNGKLHESANHRFSVLCNYILSVLEREHNIDDELVIVSIIAYINEQEKRTRSLRQMAEKMITDIAEKGLIEDSQALFDLFENIFLTELSMYEILRGKACRCTSKKDLSLFMTNIQKIIKKITGQMEH